jgi:hypothetical protein
MLLDPPKSPLKRETLSPVSSVLRRGREDQTSRVPNQKTCVYTVAVLRRVREDQTSRVPNQKTCVYTVALKRGEPDSKSPLLRGI